MADVNIAETKAESSGCDVGLLGSPGRNGPGRSRAILFWRYSEMSKHLALATLVIAALALAPTAQAAVLYWDTNGAEAGFGTGGTWGADAFWTTDSTGDFSDGGTAATTAGDVVHINQEPVANFSMGVTGSVQASRIVNPHNATGTINGSDTIHLYTSGTGTSNALISGHNDMNLTVNPDLVLEAAGGSTVALHEQGGNNSNITINGSITSTNTVDLFYKDPGNILLNGLINLQGGNFITDSSGGWRIKHVTVGDGVLGSGVGNVERSGPQGGHGGDKGRLVLGADQAYTGDTFLDTSVIRLTADTSLPSTTSVFITGVENDVTDGLMELFFTGINDISGLHFNGSQQALGTWGAIGNGSVDFTSGFFTGTGMLNVIPEPATMGLLALGGLALLGRRRRA